MNKKSTPPTVADVAKAAKVSKATAARVLGGYGVASEAARRVVLSAARTIGYQPNDLARSMSTGRTGLIGVVVGDIENAFFSLALRGISDTARSAGKNVIVTNSGEDLEREKELVNVLLRQRVEGLIIAPTDDRDVAHIRKAIESGTPVVTLDRWVQGLGADGVCGDDYNAAAEVAGRLFAAGHSNIVYVTAADTPAPPATSPDDIHISAVRERAHGFLSAALQAGMINPRENVLTGASDDAGIRRIVDTLLEREQPVTGILASDSLVGSGLYRELKDRGFRLPEDIVLVAWFDADWTRVTSPPISVVDQPTNIFGRTAVERLLRRIERSDDPPERVVIPTPFLQRGSLMWIG